MTLTYHYTIKQISTNSSARLWNMRVATIKFNKNILELLQEFCRMYHILNASKEVP